jgi:hypothetical protein
MSAPWLKPSAVLAGGALLCAAGCGAPNRANIELRKQIQTLEAQNARLGQQHAADERVIAGLRDRQGTLPTLPAPRLAELFTTHGLQFGRLTGGADLDPARPGDEGLAIYVVPTDESGEKLKAAGSFDIEAFDLADPQHPFVGRWHFDPPQARAAWSGVLLEYNYVLLCPWQEVNPKHPDLTVKVTFLDALTQTPFTAQRVIHVNLPLGPTTQTR